MHPSPNICAISPIHDSVTPNTVMSALQIPKFLKKNCLCINGAVGSYTNQGCFNSNGKISWSLKNIYLHLLPSNHFSIYFTLQKHISYEPFKISIQTLLHTFIPPTILTPYSSKFLMPPMSLGSKRSHPLSRLSYFTTTSFITPLSGYRSLTSQLHSKISCLNIISHYLPTSWKFHM